MFGDHIDALQARLSDAQRDLQNYRVRAHADKKEIERLKGLLAGAYDNSGAYVAGLQDRLRVAESGSEECRKAVSERDRLLVGARAVIARRERINKALGYEFVGEYFGSPRREQR